MALSRHLRKPDAPGAYPPDAQRVRALNHAAAELANLSEVESYLAVLALLDGLLPPRTSDLRFDALGELVAEFEPYLEGGAQRAVVAAWEKLDDQWRRGLLGGLIVERGHELVRRAEGKPPQSSSLAAFLTLFSEAGVPLRDALRVDEAFVRRLARDRFEAQVTGAIARLDATPQVRIETARTITHAFDEALHFALSADAAELVELTQRQKEIADFLSRYAPKRSRRRDTHKRRKNS